MRLRARLTLATACLAVLGLAWWGGSTGEGGPVPALQGSGLHGATESARAVEVHAPETARGAAPVEHLQDLSRQVLGAELPTRAPDPSASEPRTREGGRNRRPTSDPIKRRGESMLASADRTRALREKTPETATTIAQVGSSVRVTTADHTAEFGPGGLEFTPHDRRGIGIASSRFGYQLASVARGEQTLWSGGQVAPVVSGNQVRYERAPGLVEHYLVTTADYGTSGETAETAIGPGGSGALAKVRLAPMQPGAVRGTGIMRMRIGVEAATGDPVVTPTRVPVARGTSATLMVKSTASRTRQRVAEGGYTNDMAKRRTLATLRSVYGFDLPEELHAVWALARQIAPHQPLTAFESTLGIVLVGPFDVLAGKFSGKRRPLPPILHWRFRHDPPELLTVWTRGDRGGHAGFWMDEGPENTNPIASVYTDDDGVDAAGLLDCLRIEIERAENALSLGVAHVEVSVSSADQIARLRDLLGTRAGPSDSSIGGAFLDLRTAVRHQRKQIVVAQTRDGLGVIAPAHLYRPLEVEDDALWDALSRRDDVLTASWISEAQHALASGFPGTALKLGRDLWRYSGGEPLDPITQEAASLLVGAYEALDRPILAAVARTHAEYRWLASVNVLDYSSARVARERASANRRIASDRE